MRLALTREDDALRLIIADNGAGFRPEQPRPGTHHGLANMHERATALDAILTIESREGGGTNIELRVPARTRTASAKEERA